MAKLEFQAIKVLCSLGFASKYEREFKECCFHNLHERAGFLAPLMESSVLRTAFEQACSKGHTALAQRLWKHVEDLYDFESSDDMKALLQETVENGDFETFRWLKTVASQYTADSAFGALCPVSNVELVAELYNDIVVRRGIFAARYEAIEGLQHLCEGGDIEVARFLLSQLPVESFNRSVSGLVRGAYFHGNLPLAELFVSSSTNLFRYDNVFSAIVHRATDNVVAHFVNQMRIVEARHPYPGNVEAYLRECCLEEERVISTGCLNVLFGGSYANLHTCLENNQNR